MKSLLEYVPPFSAKNALCFWSHIALLPCLTEDTFCEWTENQTCLFRAHSTESSPCNRNALEEEKNRNSLTGKVHQHQLRCGNA